MRTRCARHRAARAALWGWAVAGLAAAPACAGEVSVRGEVLQGKVVGVTAEGVQLETVYGEGAILIPYADIERLESDARFVVLYGDDGEARGRLLGLIEAELLIGEEPDAAVRVATGQIFRSFGEQEFEGSGLEALRSRYRFWRGNLDFGFAATQATNDTGSLDVGLQVERRKGPTRLLLSGGYRYTIEQKQGEPRSTIENEVRGLLRGEYDITQRLFVFASATGEYDEVESLSLRTVPKGGVGYRIWQSPKGFLSGDVGFSYVYQRFFGGTTEDYPAVSFGGEAEYVLPHGAKFTARGEYLPSVQALTDNYLLRGSAALNVPMLSWLALKLSVFDEYNNRPAEDAKRNKLTLTAGLSLVF
jgi:putative salt-induced outer membrane protein YdiY